MPIKNYLSNASIAGIRAPDARTGRAEMYNTFAQTFDEMSRTADEFAARHLGEKQEKAALEAVKAGNFKPLEAKGRSSVMLYNKIGIAAEAARLDSQITNAVRETAAKHPKDVKRFNTEIEHVRTKMLKDMDIRLSGPASLKFDNLTAQVETNINAGLIKEQREKDGATLSFSALEMVDEASRQSYTGNIDTAAALLSRANQIRSGLVAYGYDPDSLLKRGSEAQEMMVMSFMKGEFDRTLATNPMGAMNYISGVRADGQNPNNRDLTTDNREKIIRWMESRIKDVNTEGDRQEEKYDKYVKERQKMATAVRIGPALQGRLSQFALDSDLEKGVIGPEGYTTLSKINDSNRNAEDDDRAIALLKMWTRTDTAPPEEVALEALKLVANGQMTHTTYEGFIDDLQTGKFTELSRNYTHKRNLTRIRDLAVRGGVAARWDTGAATRKDQFQQEYMQRIENKEDPKQVMADLIPKLQGYDAQNEEEVMPVWIKLKSEHEVDIEQTKEYLERQVDEDNYSDQQYEDAINEMNRWSGKLTDMQQHIMDGGK